MTAMTQQDLDAYAAVFEAEEEERRAKMTTAQLRDYRIFQGEIAARCPNCGKRDVEIDHQEEPDMIGVSYWTHYECCGYDSDARNSHCEYDANGRIVDIG